MYSISENSGGNLPEQETLIFQFLLQKFVLLFLWYIRTYYSSVSEILHWGNPACLWSNTIGFIIIGFTNWDLWFFSQGDLLQDYLLYTWMAPLRPSADIPHVGTQKDIYG